MHDIEASVTVDLILPKSVYVHMSLEKTQGVHSIRREVASTEVSTHTLLHKTMFQYAIKARVARLLGRPRGMPPPQGKFNDY